MERNQTLQEFQAMTGAEDDFAISFLEAADWNLSSAVELWFGVNSSSAPSRPQAQAQTRYNNSGFAYDVGSDDEDDNTQEERATTTTTTTKSGNEDEAAIRSIMDNSQVDRETAVAIFQASGANSEEQVRAPILQKRARLFDVGGGGSDDDDDDAEYGGVRHGIGGLTVSAAEAQMRILRAQFPTQDATPAAQPSMFAPPRWMMFRGSFEEARAKARTESKWLLVNIQEEREFQSLVLNRDLWTDDICQSLVKESFVFWQVERTSNEAQRFITLYNPAGPFPVCVIIDPRTGEQVAVLKLKRKEDDLREAFMEQVTTFCENRGMPTAPQNKQTSSPQPPPPPTTASSAVATTMATSAASAAGAPPSAVNTLGVAATPAVNASHDLHVDDEPGSAEKDVTTICFKYPDNKRVVRRFYKTTKIDMLFAYVAQNLGAAKGKEFDLVASGPPPVVLSDLQATLLNKDLCGSVIMVRVRD